MGIFYKFIENLIYVSRFFVAKILHYNYLELTSLQILLPFQNLFQVLV